SPEVVSSDFVGSTHAGVVDGLATIASGKHLVLYVWYDNEYGYSNQVIRIVEDIAGARPQVLPERLAPSALSADVALLVWPQSTESRLGPLCVQCHAGRYCSSDA